MASSLERTKSPAFAEKGSRNKRKFRTETPPLPLGDSKNLDALPYQGQSTACGLCGIHKEYPHALKLDLALASALDPCKLGTCETEEYAESDVRDVDWSDVTEKELQELVLQSLDVIFRSGVKQIVSCGYTEEAAVRAVLATGLAFGPKDIQSNIVENALAYLMTDHDGDLSSEDRLFGDLQQVEKFVLADLVCILREFRPFFSTGDALWSLLVCDMNVPHACAMECGALYSRLPKQKSGGGPNPATFDPTPHGLKGPSESLSNFHAVPEPRVSPPTRGGDAELVLNLLVRVQELQKQIREWTEWANQKVMQAARRLGKEKEELRALRQEREEMEKLRREKHALQESTMKKLSEMETALAKAGAQVEHANASVRRLESENASLRKDMESARTRAVDSAASCREVLRREKTVLLRLHSWEKEKISLQEDLSLENSRLAKLKKHLLKATDSQSLLQARRRREEKAKEEAMTTLGVLCEEVERIRISAKSEEAVLASESEGNLRKYKRELEMLEGECSRLRSEVDSSKVAAMRRGGIVRRSDGVTDGSATAAFRRVRPDRSSRLLPGGGGVKRDRECVMCLSEEMSVVFLPCAHQVVCAACNEHHHKKGMTDCPSCRSPIHHRILARFSRP